MTDCCDAPTHPCARCCWQPTRDDPLPSRMQLAEHAEADGHPLCCVCARSLDRTEPATCERCLKTSREHLAEIANLWQELPDQLGHIRSQVYDADRPGAADGRPLPGGDVLVLLGKGSAGLSDTGTTAREGDPKSLAYELGWWANVWAEARSEPQPVLPVWSAQRQVDAALGYLETRGRWAAQQHSGFGQYAEDLRSLLLRLQRATGRSEHPDQAEAECFQCGADALVRKVTDGSLCTHGRPPAFPPQWPGPVPCTIAARREEHRRDLDAWEAAHQKCRQGGAEDQWTCGRCGARYDWPRYLLACRAKVEDGRGLLTTIGWGTVRQVAAAVGSSVNTIKSWADRGVVTACCLVETQERLVWYPDADERSKASRHGQRRAG